jgi:Mg2+ and Co2+ transporter CorA
MQVDAYVATSDRRLVRVDAGGMSDEWFRDDVIRWIRITSASALDVERVLRPLELSPSIVEACANPQPPQVDIHDNVLFVSVPLWRPGAASASSLRIAGTPTTLITIQDEPAEFVERMAERLSGDQHLLSCSAAAIAFHLVEAMLRSLIPVYLSLRADVEATADTLEMTPDGVKPDNLLALRRRAARLAHVLEDYLYCIVELGEARSEKLHLAGIREGLRELAADVERGLRQVSSRKEKAM